PGRCGHPCAAADPGAAGGGGGGDAGPAAPSRGLHRRWQLHHGGGGRSMTTQRAFGALIALLLVAILAGLWRGTEPARIADLAALLRGEDSPFTRLLLAWRLPRVLAAVAVGACL